MARRLSVVAACAVACCFAGVTSCAAQQTPYRDTNIQLKDTSSDGRYSVWLMPPSVLEATIDLSTTSQNMTLSRQTPFTIDLTAKTINQFKRPISVLQANPTAPGQHYEFYYKYSWKPGVPGGKPDPSMVYALPFDPGTRCTVNQGYFGPFSHQRGSQSEYALDFNQPEGTPICAARGGVVIALKQDSNVGGRDQHIFMEAANYVIIKHSDGTYGNYAHIQQNSAAVRLGEKVKRGQRIAKVGATGFVTCAHLHFDVNDPTSGTSRVTYPVKFDTDSGIKVLSQGETYIAK